MRGNGLCNPFDPVLEFDGYRAENERTLAWSMGNELESVAFLQFPNGFEYAKIDFLPRQAALCIDCFDGT